MGIGFFSFMMCSSVQIYSMSLADDHPRAKGTAVALNTAALHLGIVIGSFSGGIIIQKIGLLHTPWVGSVMVGIALILALKNRQLDMRLSINKSTIRGI
ncbi:MFS transporter [Paenisporosarcina sp. TG20]|uniref:MFS transporter n=1 Tax=Paenisporosarcina sp. TG20 TaxID=1211706 RepID=UPI0002F5C12B|nr:MFS transporter [Paenisporosarcina sp. TG20]